MTINKTRKLPRGVKKFLRREKARLRRKFSDAAKLSQALTELSQQFFDHDKKHD